ncbi:MAG: thiamine biosynthesis lipoprotein ApbE [Actinomycetia bacterium]|nr:thiamine biosynthesis lipoprotein ApbE [Actinomycetes bacterium]
MAEPRVESDSFRAMGSDAHVILVDAPDGSMERARDRLAELERHWSRFLPDSELSRLNARPGRPVIVSGDTFDLISLAVDAWRTTEGAFDPTVDTAMRSLGYDRDLAAVRAEPTPVSPEPEPGATPGCDGIRLDAVVRMVTLPPGVTLDLGGIGKGYAADLVVRELTGLGAAGVCVNVGGDLRVVGASPDARGWSVALDPDDFGPEAAERVILLEAGAIATSTRLRRTWSHGDTTVHHLLDPRTGRSASSAVATVLVIAGDAWRAEMLTKAAFLAGPGAGPAVLERHGVTGLVVDDTGTWHPAPGFGDFVR